MGTRRSLVLRAYHGAESMVVEERPAPVAAQLGRGEVVVDVKAAPVNPSDVLFCRGEYGTKKELPCVPGFEGAGVVVDGKGVAKALIGRRVAFAAAEDGSWQTRAVVSAKALFPLLPSVSFEQGACLIVNPLTAWTMTLLAREAFDASDDKARGKRPAIVHTAAASALGRWLVPLARRQKVDVIHVVRRPEQVQLLRGMGEEHVVDLSQPDSDAALRGMCKELRARVCFDAVAGETCLRVARALPRGSTIFNYGALSNQAAMIHPGDLIFRDIALRGFWLSRAFTPKRLPRLLEGALVVQRLMNKGHGTTIARRVGLDELPGAVDGYLQHMTDGKLLLVP